MAKLEKEIKKTVNKATSSKTTKGKKRRKTGGTSTERTVRKAAKKLT
jgi:hypothetical protein